MGIWLLLIRESHAGRFTNTSTAHRFYWHCGQTKCQIRRITRRGECIRVAWKDSTLIDQKHSRSTNEVLRELQSGHEPPCIQVIKNVSHLVTLRWGSGVPVISLSLSTIVSQRSRALIAYVGHTDHAGSWTQP